MSKVETNTIDTVSGSNTMQIGSTNTATINLGVSGDTVNIPSGVTIANAGTATGFGGANTPAFLARLSSTTQSIADDTYTITLMFSKSLSAGDYLEIFLRQQSGGSLDASGDSNDQTTYFGAFKLVE
jgi:hypothetical protein